nr:MAG TPA: hypothetical protein [Caudoviricetes sp.]
MALSIYRYIIHSQEDRHKPYRIIIPYTYHICPLQGVRRFPL